MRKLIKIIAPAVLVMAVVLYAMPTIATEVTLKDESLRKGETRETVDPARYDNPTIRKAYQVAKDIPWVLDSIYCFCYCEENPYFKHKSLLSCYVDDHAAN